MSSILFLIILAIVSTDISGQAPGFNTGEAQVRWRLNCDMVGPNIEFKSGPGEQCGGLCNENRACQVFTWSEVRGAGVCFMKGGNNWNFTDGVQGSVCGYVPGRVADEDQRLITRVIESSTTTETIAIIKEGQQGTDSGIFKNAAEHTNKATTNYLTFLLVLLFTSVKYI